VLPRGLESCGAPATD